MSKRKKTKPASELPTPDELWDHYQELVYPDGIDGEQLNHVRGAFWAGVAGMYKFQMQVMDLELTEKGSMDKIEAFLKTLKHRALSENPIPGVN